MVKSVKLPVFIVSFSFAILIVAASIFGASGALSVGEAYAANTLEAGSYEGTQVVDVQANKNLKQLGLKFDLKKGKAVSFNIYNTALTGWTATRYTKIKQPWKAKITSYKVKNAKKKGYKQATITVRYTSSWKPSIAAARKVWFAGWGVTNLEDYVFGDYYYTVLDYKTGRNLEAKNPYKVTVEGNWSNHAATKTYYVNNNDEDWICFTKAVTAKVTITFPKSYKNLCFGVGGQTWTIGDDLNNGTDHVYEDSQFFISSSKKNTFAKTTMYKKGKKNVHFMRIK